MTRWLIACCFVVALPALASAQQNQCRTAPVGTATAYCASEAFVTQAFDMPLLKAQAFVGLPACSGGTEGTIAAITDSMTATWGAAVMGGGSNHVLGYCDGAAWTVVGK